MKGINFNDGCFIDSIFPLSFSPQQEVLIKNVSSHLVVPYINECFTSFR